MKLNSLLISSMLFLATTSYAADITVSEPQSDMPVNVTVVENVKKLANPDEIRQLLSQNNYKVAKEKLQEISNLLKTGEIKDAGILRELEASVQYHEIQEAYGNFVKVLNTDYANTSSFDKSTTILNAIESGKLLSVADDTLAMIKLAKQVLTTDKDILLKKKEIELNPSLDAKRISNPAVPLAVDVVAVKMLEAKIHKIDLLLSDIAIMEKSLNSMYKHIVATKQFYSEIKTKIEKEQSEHNTKVLLSILSVAGILTVLGFIGRQAYLKNQAIQEKRAKAKEINLVAQEIQNNIQKLNVLGAHADMINEFQNKLKVTTDIMGLNKLKEDVATAVNKGVK